MQCGLLGEKLGHSYSPQIHHILGEYTYSLFEKQPHELEDFLRNGEFKGLNVTIPYKKSVIPFCDSLSDRANRLGAVNTIVRKDNGTLVGHNTDYFGFSSMVEQCGIDVRGKKALVLGSGGASNTAVAVLQELGADVIVISRSGENNYNNISLHRDASVIVNATPVGMYPKTGVSPVDLTIFQQLEAVLDLIYNPARTQLLLDAEKLGIPCMNGLWMLIAQAWESSQWFTGETLDSALIADIYCLLLRQMENIVLVGMPGCGKSTIGKLLANDLGKLFVDADAEIEKTAGCSIPEIFASQGEEGFRKIETSVLEKLGKRSGLVIATGGGCVTRNENYPLLHQNGTIVWIKRSIDQLPTNGRPLSQQGSLYDMYQTRHPMYRSFADLSIENSQSAPSAVEDLISLLEETK